MAVRFWWLLCCSSPAWAQVNAEFLRTNPLQAGLSAAGEVNLSLARGNIEVIDIGGAAKVQYLTLHADTATHTPPYIAQRIFLTVNGRFADRAGTTFVSQSYAHLRWTGMWHPRLGTDVFTQLQYNEFFRLRQRLLMGAGARAELVHLAPLMIWGGSGLMLEQERIDVSEGSLDAEETLDLRWTNYLSARATFLEDRFLLQNTVYLQPLVGQIKDFRLLEEFEVLAKVTQHLGLGTLLSVLYDAKPPTGVKTTDLRLTSSFRFFW